MWVYKPFILNAIFRHLIRLVVNIAASEFAENVVGGGNYIFVFF